MKKGLKITLITLGSIVGVIAVAIGGFAIYLNSTPDFTVQLLKKGFGGETVVINAPDYEEVKAWVDIHKDFEYPSKDGKNQYDIYLPKDVDKALPTIVWVHGGAFVAGTKDGIENYAVTLADQGYAVVGVDYQWAQEIRYPRQVRQIEECMTALSEVKDQYFLDLNNIIVVGDSAGAHIAAQAALLVSSPAYEEAIGVESAIANEQLKGAILYCGPYNVEAMLNTGNSLIDFFVGQIGWAMFGDKNWKDGDLIKTTTIKDYITPDFPASFITDGNDGPFESQGKELAKALTDIGVDCETLFFHKVEFGTVNHEYQFNIGDEGAGSLCYEKTIEYLDGLNLN